jgi:hypothetical protein
MEDIYSLFRRISFKNIGQLNPPHKRNIQKTKLPKKSKTAYTPKPTKPKTRKKSNA